MFTAIHYKEPALKLAIWAIPGPNAFLHKICNVDLRIESDFPTFSVWAS